MILSIRMATVVQLCENSWKLTYVHIHTGDIAAVLHSISVSQTETTDNATKYRLILGI